LRRRTILRGILRGVGWRCSRRLSLLADFRRSCPRHDHRDGGSRQRTQSENGGQIHTHTKLDATNQSPLVTWNSSFRSMVPDLPGCRIHPTLTLSATASDASLALPLPAKCSIGTGPAAGGDETSSLLPIPTRNQPSRSAIAESGRSEPGRFQSLLSWS
jgi:hypothetical protein